MWYTCLCELWTTLFQVGHWHEVKDFPAWLKGKGSSTSTCQVINLHPCYASPHTSRLWLRVRGGVGWEIGGYFWKKASSLSAAESQRQIISHTSLHAGISQVFYWESILIWNKLLHFAQTCSAVLCLSSGGENICRRKHFWKVPFVFSCHFICCPE